MAFQHVPHMENSWADWLANMGRLHGQDVDLWDLVDVVPWGEAAPRDLSPPSTGDHAHVDSQLAVRDAPEPPPADMECCRECSQWAPCNGLRQCHSCGGWWHPTCVQVPPAHHGPWHCDACCRYHRAAGTRDVTLDASLLRYLALGELPADRVARRRIRGAARYTTLDAKGRVWLGPEDAARVVPPIFMRR